MGSVCTDHRHRWAALQSGGPEAERYVSGSVPVFWCVCGIQQQSPPGLSLLSLCHFLAAQMYRAPVRPQRSPGAPRPAGRFPSPSSCWGFPGARSGHRGGSPRGGPAYSPGSPVYCQGSNRAYSDGSPFSGFGCGSRGFGGQTWRRGGGFRRPQSFSPASAPNSQSGSSDSSVEKYFSPSMLQDPWASLQPVAQAGGRPDRKLQVPGSRKQQQADGSVLTS